MTMTVTAYMTGVASMVTCIMSIVRSLMDLAMNHAPVFCLIAVAFIGVAIKIVLELWSSARVSAVDFTEIRKNE